MKFKEYLEKLQKFAQENPESLEMNVIYSKDDEGNGFQEVWSKPSIGMFDGDEEFINCKEDIEDMEDGEYKPNAVCIN